MLMPLRSEIKDLITHKQKSHDVGLCLIAKNSFCLFDLLLYVHTQLKLRR